MASELERELAWRFDAWELLQKSPNWPLLEPSELRELRLYGGASGVWQDKVRTSSLAPEGVTVSLLHTGRHYTDDFDETGILYHYPTTERPEARDANEIQSIKNAKIFGLPVFVIANVGSKRKVNLAWLNDFDDSLRICVLTFHGILPAENKFVVQDPLSLPLFDKRKKSTIEVVKAERDPLFRFNILKRFKGICALTGLDVPNMLEAAHIIPVSNGGTENPMNGLLLSASTHKAFDANLWAINPKSLQIETKKNGPSLTRMKIQKDSLLEYSELLNIEAVEFRYEKVFLTSTLRSTEV